MQKEYKTKDMKPSSTKKKEEVLPIYKKRNIGVSDTTEYYIS